jgi:hypothetical protein
MALPSQDPRVPRMPTWLFFAFLVWVAFITYVAQIRHLWWGWLGCLVTVQVALFMRKKWRNPGVVDRWGKPMHERSPSTVRRYGQAWVHSSQCRQRGLKHGTRVVRRDISPA